MAARRLLQKYFFPVTAVALATTLSLWVLLAPRAQTSELARASSHALLRPTGEPQLVSVEPMPMPEGETCVWQPASAATTLSAALLQERQQASAADKRYPEGDRPPARVIHDPNPSFSSVAVEPNSNMVVVTDENLFQVLEYDRTDNTPRNAKMTEPKRVIGGILTKAEMICGSYIDPKTLETYVVNNDTQNWLAVFSKNAKGNVAPDRFLAVPHGTFGISVDETRQEMYLSVQHDNAVVVYPKTASGRDKPIRTLSGDDTQIEDPHGTVVDTKHNLLIVANHGNVSFRGNAAAAPQSGGGGEEGGGGEVGGSTRYQPGSGKFEPPSLTIYARDAQGNTPPLRRIIGPKTRLNWPAQITVDEEQGDIYVANDMDHSIIVFKVTDNGDVAPHRVLAGPKTGLQNPTGIALDFKHKEMWVSSMGNHTAGVFPLAAEGNTAPLRTIRGGPVSEPSLMIGNPGGVAYDSKRQEILVPN